VLREWLATPVSPFAMDFEAMIRLFIAPLGTKEQIVATLQQVRDDAQEMLRFGGAVKQEFLDGRAALQDQAYGLPPRPGRRLLHQPAHHRRRLGRAHPRGDRGMGRPLARREERPRPRDHGPATDTDSRRAPRPHTGAASNPAATASLRFKQHALRLMLPTSERPESDRRVSVTDDVLALSWLVRAG
jgi:hypothetical protein